MTNKELAILGNSIKKLIKSNRSAWIDLKKEIEDYGYQSYYCSQDYFKQAAIKEVFSLSKEAKEKLIKEWKRSYRLIKLNTDDEILNQYALIVIDKIVSRARAAGARTVNW